ncbi:hypothetical protein chiPu_0000218 [Chiloscyllium punctatum]|uniref:Uncharacterized protein n=1 Tax=Chiloscyllium punctatum TaxID=137246 RepID=A0A401RUJ3_CHIPU|nr:hypothetical protein [Chiloscyllium punctatum]
MPVFQSQHVRMSEECVRGSSENIQPAERQCDACLGVGTQHWNRKILCLPRTDKLHTNVALWWVRIPFLAQFAKCKIVSNILPMRHSQ